MRTACSTTKATDTQLEYVILSTNTTITQTHHNATFTLTLPILLPVWTVTNFHIMSLRVSICGISEHQRFGTKFCVQFQNKNVAWERSGLGLYKKDVGKRANDSRQYRGDRRLSGQIRTVNTGTAKIMKQSYNYENEDCSLPGPDTEWYDRHKSFGRISCLHLLHSRKSHDYMKVPVKY